MLPQEKRVVLEYQLKEQKYYLKIKRILDICCSLIALFTFSFLFVLIAVLIKMEDKKGPIIFKQIRVGKDGRLFNMYKFRSMVSNAEELKASLLQYNEVSGPVFKIRKDPRVTKIGKILRKTSLDEFPQLINVLKGEMSLVGPRPPLPIEVDKYSLYEKQRLSVVPGLTCYWQVSGRSNMEFSEWVELDLKYIRERSTLVDLKLICKTALVLFGSKNAY
ncbi:sugar transferase [Niallia taxi]|uniref:sugar transferase n=1 Tax=Niallia taxi TaxID=2499688 RepID=UPI003981FE7B